MFFEALLLVCVGSTGEQQQRHRDGEEGEAPVLGQLVWNPFPASLAQASANGAEEEEEEEVSPEEELDRAGGDVSSVDSEEERGGSSSRQADGGGRGRRHGVLDDGRDVNATRRRPWEEAYPPRAPRSLSPAAVRNRAATDVAEADGARSSRRVSSALPIPARRLGTVGWFGRTHANDSGNPAVAAAAGDMVPSAERLVASILQVKRGKWAWAQLQLLLSACV